MKIIAANEMEASAIKRVLSSINNLLSALPTYRGDFIDPGNAFEYALMWEFHKLPVEINQGEILLNKQCAMAVESWEEE